MKGWIIMRNFNKKRQIEIGRTIYEGIITIPQAMEMYNRNESTIYNYLRLYKNNSNIPIMHRERHKNNKTFNTDAYITFSELNKLNNMNKNDLIMEILKLRINATEVNLG